MARSKSSKQWLKEHFEDDYVRQSKELGLRSRASFKLLEIQEKDKLFKAGMTVVDLGAAPGGWSQVAAKFVGTTEGRKQQTNMNTDKLKRGPPNHVFNQGQTSQPPRLTEASRTREFMQQDPEIQNLLPRL